MKRKTSIKSLMAALLLIAVAGCSGLVPGSGPPADYYMLSPKSTFSDKIPEVGWQLVVEEPQASGVLSTQRIALTRKDMRIQYYAGARWTEAAPRMIQTLLVESFENTNKIVAVGRQAVTLRSDFNLKMELREFQAELGGPKPKVRVRINSKIIKMPKRKIIASRTFERLIEAEDTSMDAVVRAFDKGLGKVLKRIVEWTLLTAR